MEQSNQAIFRDRIQKIEKTRRKAGLPVAGKPAQRPWLRLEMGLKLAALSAAAVIAVKAGFMIALGPQDYMVHRNALLEGNLIDQLGAGLMTPDVVTRHVVRLRFGDAALASLQAAEDRAGGPPVVQAVATSVTAAVPSIMAHASRKSGAYFTRPPAKGDGAASSGGVRTLSARDGQGN